MSNPAPPQPPAPTPESKRPNDVYGERLKPSTQPASPLAPPTAYSVALDIRKFEIELYWKRAAYFWVFTGAALAAYLAALTGKDVENRALALLLTSCTGLVFAVAWYLVNRASKYWQLNWEYHVDLLEKEHVGDLYKTVLEVENSSFWPLSGPYPYSVSKINQWLSLFVAVAFLMLVAYTLHEQYYFDLNGNWFPATVLVATSIALGVLFFRCKVSGPAARISVKMRSTTVSKVSSEPNLHDDG